MLRKPILVGLAALMITGCGASPTQGEMLPTTTVQPTPVTPTVTATFLPPPTVTPFPTVTPRQAGGSTDEGNGSADTPSGDAAASPTDAATAPTRAPGTAGFPPGVTIGSQVLNAPFERGWPSEESPTANYSIQNGQYVFNIGPFDGRFLASTQVSEDDMYVQVDVTPTQCPADGGYGLFFRYSDASNYYAFTVFCDGSYRVVSRVNGEVSGSTEGAVSGGNPAAAQIHTVGVKAEGSDFFFFFDGQEVGTFTNDQLSAGDVAIYAVAGGAEVLSIAFDNLQVWTLN